MNRTFIFYGKTVYNLDCFSRDCNRMLSPMCKQIIIKNKLKPTSLFTTSIVRTKNSNNSFEWSFEINFNEQTPDEIIDIFDKWSDVAIDPNNFCKTTIMKE